MINGIINCLQGVYNHPWVRTILGITLIFVQIACVCALAVTLGLFLNHGIQTGSDIDFLDMLSGNQVTADLVEVPIDPADPDGATVLRWRLNADSVNENPIKEDYTRLTADGQTEIVQIDYSDNVNPHPNPKYVDQSTGERLTPYQVINARFNEIMDQHSELNKINATRHADYDIITKLKEKVSSLTGNTQFDQILAWSVGAGAGLPALLKINRDKNGKIEEIENEPETAQKAKTPDPLKRSEKYPSRQNSEDAIKEIQDKEVKEVTGYYGKKRFIKWQVAIHTALLLVALSILLAGVIQWGTSCGGLKEFGAGECKINPVYTLLITQGAAMTVLAGRGLGWYYGAYKGNKEIVSSEANKRYEEVKKTKPNGGNGDRDGTSIFPLSSRNVSGASTVYTVDKDEEATRCQSGSLTTVGEDDVCGQLDQNFSSAQKRELIKLLTQSLNKDNVNQRAYSAGTFVGRMSTKPIPDFEVPDTPENSTISERGTEFGNLTRRRLLRPIDTLMSRIDQRAA